MPPASAQNGMPLSGSIPQLKLLVPFCNTSVVSKLSSTRMIVAFFPNVLGCGHHRLSDGFGCPGRNFLGGRLIGRSGEGNAERKRRESVEPVHGYPPVWRPAD